jgi:UDP-2,4-diacetamido-2,4,6-trideoxy-beta-L-altropyranose hydrolase
MNIAFRVDASHQIGTGHLMRCLTLADRLKSRGAVTCFISRHMPDHLRDLLSRKKHEFRLLNSSPMPIISNNIAHAAWLGTTQEADAQDVLQELSDNHWDWLVVDHYAIDARWETALRSGVDSILVIDDLADRQHDCDVLLDQNFYLDMTNRYYGKVPGNCELLLGPRYALLRDEFRVLHENITIRSGPVQRILVFFGGVDSNNFTGLTIKSLSAIEFSGIHVDIVVGTQHPFLEDIEAACSQYGFTCHIDTDRMAELMAAADLAIGAGGSATWERCCLGLPSIAVSTATNQNQQILDAALNGLIYAPDIKKNFQESIKKHIFSMIENSLMRRYISSKAIQLVDGKGSKRIVDYLIYKNIEIRTATESDSESIFLWRNHHAIRAVSRNAKPIVWEDHELWFKSVLNDTHRYLLIAEKNCEPIGVVRFDKNHNLAEVSIYLVPEMKNSGSGYSILRHAEKWLQCNLPEVQIVVANVLGKNGRSRNFFLNAGYQLESSSYFKRIN